MPEWQVLVDVITRYLAVLNSSINFIIYCIAGKQFRAILTGIFQLKTGQVLFLLLYFLAVFFAVKSDKSLRRMLRVKKKDKFELSSAKLSSLS